MKDSRPLEFLLWRASIVLGVFLVFGGGGGFSYSTAPGYPFDISQIYKEPHVFRHGVLGSKNKPAMTYSPTPTKVQYHRREES